MSQIKVGIVMGSANDYDIFKNAEVVLKEFGIAFETRVLSAHRTPDALFTWMAETEKRGLQVYIAGAGMAAHLAGTVAAHTVKPVLGVPLDAGTLGGIDSLLSTVQMPAGIPVGTTAIGNAGAKNAAYLAVQILSLQDVTLVKKLQDDRQQKASAILSAKLS